MDIVVLSDIQCITLTYEEELSLAQTVMDCIALRWVTGEFQELLDRIYYLKCTRGYWPRADDIVRLLEFIEHYNLKPPMMMDDGTNLKKDFYKDISPDEVEMESRRMIIMAWREVWNSHTDIKAIADFYKTFPGDNSRFDTDKTDPKWIVEQDIIEGEFWYEVDNVVLEWECNRQDAIIMVSDYMPRGDYFGISV